MEDVTLAIAEPDAAGIHTAVAILAGRELRRFEATRAELTEFGIRLAGGEVPAPIRDAAAAERARRLALGRTLCEVIPASVTRIFANFPPQAGAGAEG